MVPLILFAALLQEADAGKVADIKNFSGDVNVVNAKGEARRPKKVGRRLRDVSLFDEDRIATADGAECEVLFPDDSTLTLKAKSEIQILEKSLPKATPDGKTIGRRIRLLVGDMVTQVVPNKNVQTDFETPSGTAAVRGTGVVFHVDPVTGNAVVTVTEGTVQFFNSDNQLLVTLSAGQSAQFAIGADGGLQVDILADAGSLVSGSLGDTPAQFNAGDQLRVDVRDGQVQAQVINGDVNVLGPGGDWMPLDESFRGGINPDLGQDPFAQMPNRFGPPMGLLFPNPEFVQFLPPGEINFFFYGPGNFFLLDQYQEPDPTVSFTGIHDSWHSVFLGSRLWTHVFEDPWGPGSPHNIHMFPLPNVENAFHNGVTLSQIVNNELFGAHMLWHDMYDSDPTALSHHADFHGGPIAGFDALDADLRLWASQAEAGIFDDHLLGHVLLGLRHYSHHIENDCDAFGYAFEHGNLHLDLANLHNQLHAGDLHGFLHGFIDQAHTEWHNEMAATETCFDFDVAGPCKDAHDHFHAEMNAFHDHMHQAFGIP